MSKLPATLRTYFLIKILSDWCHSTSFDSLCFSPASEGLISSMLANHKVSSVCPTHTALSAATGAFNTVQNKPLQFLVIGRCLSYTRSTCMGTHHLVCLVWAKSGGEVYTVGRCGGYINVIHVWLFHSLAAAQCGSFRRPLELELSSRRTPRARCAHVYHWTNLFINSRAQLSALSVAI